MSHYYFAETFHPRGGLIVGAILQSDRDLNADVAHVLRGLGLAPGEDELAASIPAPHHPILAPLAARFRELVRARCRVGLVILPDDQRIALGAEALKGLARLILVGSNEEAKHHAYFGKGLFPSTNGVARLSESLHPLARCRLHLEQRSKRVLALQLARYAAHACGVRLTECLGVASRAARPIGVAQVGDFLFESISLSSECDDAVHFALQSGFGLLPETRLH